MSTVCDGRSVLFVVFVFCLADIIAIGRGPCRRVNIVVKVTDAPWLAEGLVRLLLWERALLGGARVKIRLVADGSSQEMLLLGAMLYDEGFLDLEASAEPDLVYAV